MIFGDLAVLEFGYGADREIMIIEIPLETLVIQVQLDYGTDYGSYISDSSFETKLETAMELDSTVDIVVQSTEDLATTSLIVNYEIHIYGNSSETYDTIEAIQDQLYKDAVDGGWELPDDYEGYSFHAYNTVPIPTDNLTSEEILRFRDEAYLEYHQSEKFLSKIEKKYGKQAVNNILKNCEIKLKRKILGD